MRNVRRLSLVSVIVMLAAGCASGPSIRVDKDPGTDLTQYKTFAFFDQVATDRAQYSTGASYDRHVAGPSATASWYSAETTRYTGPRRALQLDAQLAYYPKMWSSFMDDVVDMGGTLGITLPVPLGRRQTIRAFARARSLVSGTETGLLQVGGDQALGVLWQRSSRMEPEPFDDVFCARFLITLATKPAFRSVFRQWMQEGAA